MGKKAEDGDQIEIDDVEVLDDEAGQTESVGDEDNSITDQDGDADDGEDTEGDDDEVVVSIGEEAPPPEETTRAPEWVRELRKADREKARRIKELEAKLNAAAATETKPVALGAKPKLEDHDYDTEKFEAALAD